MVPKQLEPRYLIETMERLVRRIEERFPNAILVHTAEAVLDTARRARDRTIAFSRPIWWLRLPIFVLIVSLPTILIYELVVLDLSFVPSSLSELISFFQASVESLVFIGIGIAFLMTLETRFKRRRALAAVHELRELAHIIDMHQLDKDPAYVMEAATSTPSSPARTMTAFELNRYLDYCSELLALIGKVAAIYGQRMADPVALEAVDQVENLTTSLSRKIWQKLMILDND
ncbi:MAG: hypothetical protein H6832_01695 [Planctomycetes bacterium]|nr:hypothetical protein [Planctomycetota bacterium]MCB9917100.1 hypothetical protein [Planctomycetota bacterium]